ncbi:ChaN family lipoprotein [Roseobacteraceae bacterium NS-SX3]
MKKLYIWIRQAAAAAAAAAAVCAAAPGQAGGSRWAEGVEEAAAALAGADVAILGEVHDNPAHHRNQAALIEALRPRAVVWEMLTGAQAASLTPELLADPADLAEALEWESSGWPPFALYAPVFAAAAQARHYGAWLPRAAAGEAMQQGAAAAFGPEAARYGLDRPLPADEQAAREADQMAAHCNALPAQMLPGMVEVQRLRDAMLAAAVVKALEETGGPVAVITGNGHARTGRGLAVYLAQARPATRVMSLGQAEAGQIAGRFDLLLDAPPAERPDPCDAFRSN